MSRINYLFFISIRNIIEKFRKMTGRSLEIKSDPSRFRPERQTYSFGDHNLLTLRTGWVPLIPLEKSLMDVYTYWKNKLTERNNYFK